MAKDKKSFLMYCDIFHTVKQLPDDKAGELFKHILSYVNDENPVSTDPLINIAFEPIKQSFKRDLIKWDGIRKSRSKAGKASAEKRKQKQQVLTSVESVQQTSTNPTVSVSVSGSVNDSVINKTPIVPLLDEFLKYARETLNGEFQQYEEAIRFKYLAWKENNWHTGGEKPRKIKNWKTTLLNTFPHMKKQKTKPKEISA